jgi:hypothetical protein
MALDLTKQAEAAIRAKDMYTKFENKFSSYGAFKAYLDGANALLPQDTLERLKSNQNARSVVFPVLTKQALTVITARSCAIVGTEPVSALPTIAKVTRGFEIKIYDKVSDNNYISATDAFANQMMNGLRSVLANLDTYAASQLEANKSAALAATGLTGVAIVANAYQIALAQRDKLYYYIPTLMALNDLGGSTFQNVANTEARALMLEYETKGIGADVNMRGVLEGDLPSASGYRHYLSNRVTNGAGVSETHYIDPFGSIGVFTWNDSDAINRREGPNGAKLYTLADQVMGITWDVYEEPICTDLTATYGAGYERTMGTRYQFAADFGFFNAYSSDTTKPIIKIEVKTT